MPDRLAPTLAPPTALEHDERCARDLAQIEKHLGSIANSLFWLALLGAMSAFMLLVSVAL